MKLRERRRFLLVSHVCHNILRSQTSQTLPKCHNPSSGTNPSSFHLLHLHHLLYPQPSPLIQKITTFILKHPLRVQSVPSSTSRPSMPTLLPRVCSPSSKPQAATPAAPFSRIVIRGIWQRRGAGRLRARVSRERELGAERIRKLICSKLQ